MSLINFFKTKSLLIIALFEIILFLFLRFYNIDKSLFFFNDMGRDLRVLQTWQETSKPPLLGPQTSALPFNQSAIYFYYLYPFYLISNHSPLTALYANAFLYIISFLTGIFLLRHHPKYQKILLLLFFFVSIHPQYIIQSRFVWNPSLVTPFIVSALFSYLILKDTYSHKLAWLFAFSLAAAVSLSYSIAPLLIILLAFAAYQFRHHILPLLFFLTTAFAVINLPTLAFELKHKFVLTSAVITQKSPPQKDIDFLSKLKNLSNFGVSSLDHNLNYFLFALLTITLLIILFNKKLINSVRLIALLLTVLLVLTVILPITVQAHYIFAILVLIFFLLSNLSPKFIIITVVILSAAYLNPPQLRSYFKDAPRTFGQLQSCFKSFCTNHQQPLFVTVQSSYHPYHHGPEHRYLLKTSGCNVLNIEDNPNSSKDMAVVVDGGSYNHGQTKYYELDLFGKSKVIETIKCQDNLQIYLLTKEASP